MTYFRDLRQIIGNEIRQLRERKLKVALIGQSGSGKSSLLRKLLGEKINGALLYDDSHSYFSEYEYEGIIIADIPSYDQYDVGIDEWLKNYEVDTYDVYVVVLSREIIALDKKIINVLREWKSNRNYPCFVVRNNMDSVWDENLTERESAKLIHDDIYKFFDFIPEKKYFVSCKTKCGIEDLKKNILGNVKELEQRVLFDKVNFKCLNDLKVRYAKAEGVLQKYIENSSGYWDNSEKNIMMLSEMAYEICHEFSFEKLDSFDYFARKDEPQWLYFSGLEKLECYGSEEKIIEMIERSDRDVRYFINPDIWRKKQRLEKKYVIQRYGEFYIEECYSLAKSVVNSELSHLQV